MSRRILVVDDEAGLRHTLTLILRDEGYTVAVASDGEEGLRLAQADPPDLVLCDVRMPRCDGLDFLERYRSAGGEGLVIMMSAYGSLDSAVEAMRRGAYDYISKPFNADEVILTLRKAEEREQLRREVAWLRRAVGALPGFQDVVARADSMREVLELASRVAPFPSTVLITGESGSGKEAIARAIHRASPRSGKPFVAVNCGAIPENLLESELFGHEKGAFTGADRARVGMFEEADGGTLFLDEIGELGQSLQVKLLRVLQERSIRRVGGSGERAVDVRVLTATARDLVEEVKGGRFRDDLYYRINVVQVHVPPLRTRPEDIPPLTQHFLERHAKRLGIGVPPATPALLAALSAYPWPGNVRELENALERALVVSGGVPGPEHLPPHIQQGQRLFDVRDDSDDLSVKRRLPALERSLIERALKKSGGNRTRAAEILDLSVRALTYKIQDYGLE